MHCTVLSKEMCAIDALCGGETCARKRAQSSSPGGTASRLRAACAKLGELRCRSRSISARRKSTSSVRSRLKQPRSRGTRFLGNTQLRM